MDFLTHSLIGAGAARLICPKREWIPQVSLAGMLGSLIPDSDSWLALIGPEYYGLYHRTITHSIIGLTACSFLAAGVSSAVLSVRLWRRFGWFVSTNLNRDFSPTKMPVGVLLLAASMGAVLHWCFDIITGFGNMKPFWPWRNWEASLHAVNSFDAFIFSTTMAWHLVIRNFEWKRKREAAIAGAYFVLMILYVGARLKWGQPTVW